MRDVLNLHLVLSAKFSRSTINISEVYRGVPNLVPPPGTLVGDKNTTFGPVQDAINLFRYDRVLVVYKYTTLGSIYILVYIHTTTVLAYIGWGSSPNK